MDLALCPESQLASMLEDIHCELRMAKEELYKMSNYLCLQASFQRHLSRLGCPLNIVPRMPFPQANRSLDGVLKDHKRKEKEPQVHRKNTLIIEEHKCLAVFFRKMC